MFGRKKIVYSCLVWVLAFACTAYYFSDLHRASAGVKVYSPERIPTVFLLSVGSNNNKGLAKFLYAESDVLTLAAEMQKRVRYRKQGAARIQTRILTADQITRESLLNTLDAITREITSDDIFIFHFAGAGSQLQSGGDFFLATPAFDHQLDVKAREAALDTYAIRGELLKAYFARIRAKTKVLIFDTGISEFVCDQGDSFFSQRQSNSLFIGTRNLSFDIVGGKSHGTVTGILLDAIRGGADFNYDGRVTAWETLAFFGNVKYDERRNKQTERDVQFCTTTQGVDFDLTYTDQRLSEVLAAEARASDQSPSPSPIPDRSDPFVTSKKPQQPEPVRKHAGKSYAVLFAFDEYDSRWTPLANPKNDTREIARELQDRYKFSEVLIKNNLTIAEFEEFIDSYKTRQFDVDDQVFFFIAGHGTASEYNNGYLVAKDSPGTFDKRLKGSFISLDEMLAEIDRIQSKHVMVVFDACFAGRLWRPAYTLVKSEVAADRLVRPSSLSSIPGVFAFAPAGPDDDKLTKDELITRELAERSRVVLTSGWDVVSDGKPGTNSPFAKQFLNALRKAPDENGLVTLTDIMSYVKRVKNRTPPELGRIDSLGAKNSGGFVFCQGGCSTPEVVETSR